MKDKYEIRNAYPDSLSVDEITIESNKLYYIELCNMSGVKVMNSENEDLIHEKCAKISELIKEIDKLNQL